jgi:hypothetical protein
VRRLTIAALAATAVLAPAGASDAAEPLGACVPNPTGGIPVACVNDTRCNTVGETTKPIRRLFGGDEWQCTAAAQQRSSTSEMCIQVWLGRPGCLTDFIPPTKETT